MNSNTKSLLLYALMCAGFVLSACCKTNTSNSNIIPSAQANTTSAHASQGSAVRTYTMIGVLSDMQPISFMDHKSRNYIGHDIDLAKEACKRAEMECRFKPVFLSDIEKELVKDKTVDAIWSNIVITNERKKVFAFSEPYIKGKQIIMVRADSPIKTKADLGGTKVIVEKDSVGEQMVRALSGSQAPAEIITTTGTVEASQHLFAGNADAVVYDNLTLEYYAANTPGKLRVIDDPLREDDIGVAVRPDDILLLGKINKALATMQADGTSRKIYENWYSKK